MSAVSERLDLSGTTIADGKYQLLHLLGEGGGGQVYVGEQVALSRRVAIKVLAEEHARHEEMLTRFLREARATSRAEHENIISILDFGSTGTGTVYIAMELLEGEDLAHLIVREAPLPWSRTRTIILQVCRALHVAHSNGVLHRDMKPENCFRITHRKSRDFIKVLDFGIAKIFGDEAEPEKSLSGRGDLFGSPAYMSPEQSRGIPADDRSDVYAVGVMLFEMLTGKVPFFSHDSYLMILLMHTTYPIPLPSAVAPHAGISPAVDALVLKALAKEPSERFQSMKDLAEAMLAIPDVPIQAGYEPWTVDKAPSLQLKPKWLEQPNAKLTLGLAGVCLLLFVLLTITLALG